MFTNISDKAILALYKARTLRHLATALFTPVDELIPNNFQVLVLRPNSNKAQVFCSRPEYQAAYERYIESTQNDESELGGGADHPETPSDPKQKAIAQRNLRKSRMYQEFMTKTDTEYAMSLVAGKLHSWQACLTVLRTDEQGSFSEKEISGLQTFRSHFQSAIERVVGLGEGELCRKTLETFIWGLPSAVVVMDWDMKVLYFNALALDISECWKTGLQYSHTKKAKAMTLPGDILAVLEQEKAKLISLKANSAGTQKALFLADIKHPKLREFVAKLYFHPSQSVVLNGGTFFVSLHRQSEIPDDRNTYDSFSLLSPRERDVVLLAAEGKKSNEIAERLGTAPITVRMQLYSAYKKLGIKTRYELVSMFSHHPVVSIDAQPTKAVLQKNPEIDSPRAAWTKHST